MKKVLLHICCGVCAIGSVKELQEKGFEVVGFYFNPNIYPQEEYNKRKEVVAEVEKITQIKVVYGEYDNVKWENYCIPQESYRDLSEGGVRCFLCYEYRLRETYKKLLDLRCDFFTTTLTISPYKKSKDIFEIGKKIDKEKFLGIDFKKKDGFKKTILLSKELNFYHQNYCGCRYSMRRR